ncbi:hypothetical protein [Modestobacter altitudinis]|uniref:hypothetical protein n=1 Tax=Modestobacter altitudinis TaxID=2213158 RepID=UPI00148677EA|nr:hypothetical protein [Modestobacter altitudinis]
MTVLRKSAPPQRGWPWVVGLAVMAAAEVGITVATGSVEQGVLAAGLFIPLLR